MGRGKDKKPRKRRLERPHPAEKNELGNRHGFLTVIAQAESVGKGARWLCRCDCGNEVIVRGADLRREASRSCGCFRELSQEEREEMGYLPAKWRREKAERLAQCTSA